MHLLSLQQVWLYGQIEWQRLLFTRRGWLTMLSCALLWFVLLRYLVVPVSVWMQEPATVLGAEWLAAWVDVRHLLHWPAAELSIFWVLALLLVPPSAVLFTAGQICRDRSRGTLRFYSLRSHRVSILLGRFLGQLALLGTLVLFALLATLTLIGWQQGGISSAVFSAACYSWLLVMVTLLPFVALMSLMSVLTASSRGAASLAIAFLALLPLLVGTLAPYWSESGYLLALLPGAHIQSLISTRPWQPGAVVWLPLLQCLAYLSLSAWYFQRRSL